jgi:SAM-dependent methyltransferase
MPVKQFIPKPVKTYLKGILGVTRIDEELAALRRALAERQTASSHAANPPAAVAPVQPEQPSSFDIRVGAPKSIRVQGKPGPHSPQCEMTVTTDSGSVTELLHTSYLCLAKLITEYEFQTVLDIGSGQGSATRIFRHVGKDVTTVEIIKEWDADYRCDYLDIELPQQYDLIWCSHILEHQRDVGRFLEKTLRDLKDGGILALTVPNKGYDILILGHVNLFNTSLLLYNLICAGYDCSKAIANTYEGNLSVIVRKVPNGLDRTAFAQVPFGNPAGNRPEAGHLQDVYKFFPIPTTDYMLADIPSINWNAYAKQAAASRRLPADS